MHRFDDDRYPPDDDDGSEPGSGPTERRISGVVPPTAINTEAAVLGHALWHPEVARQIATELTPEHFYSDAHRWIFEAVANLARDGAPTNTPRVLDELKRMGRLEQVESVYVTNAVRWHVEDVPIADSVAFLDDVARRRRFIQAMQGFTAEGYLGNETTTELLDRAQKAVVELAEGARRQGLPVLTARDLAEELPDLPWLVPDLGIAPGPPVLVAGYGYSRKTMALQALAVSVAAGRDAWGRFSVRQGPVLHIDFEQGRRLTQERYQRLARGLQVNIATLPIELAALPEMHLDTAGAESVLTRACAGKALVIIDSLRASVPSADENSSEIRGHLDMLNRISERTAATFIVIHHAKKPQKDDAGGARYSLRGSSALFDACAGIFVFTGEKGEPTRVHHEKERNRGVTVEAFGIDAADLDHPVTMRPNWGLVVRHLESDGLPKARTRPRPVRAPSLEDLCDAVLTAVAAEPGCTKGRLCELIKGRKQSIFAACDELESRGALSVERDGQHHRMRLV